MHDIDDDAMMNSEFRMRFMLKGVTHFQLITYYAMSKPSASRGERTNSIPGTAGSRIFVTAIGDFSTSNLLLVATMSAIRGFIFGVVATLAAMNIFQGRHMKPLLLLLDSGAVLDVASLHTNTNAVPPPATEEHTTSIILISNLVPMHPDINMTVGILDSAFNYLEGLSPSTPVYISIDGLSDPESTWVKNIIT